MSDDNRLKVSVEVVLEKMILDDLLITIILLTEIKNRRPKVFDIAVNAIKEADL